MGFDYLGNSQWRHSIYPYPFEKPVPEDKKKKARTAALNSKKHAAQLEKRPFAPRGGGPFGEIGTTAPPPRPLTK